ncbi:MAG: SurA N-terminal domain-containing protein [Chromatiaceae bacterium]
MRERAQGWIAWAIVVLISIPFALWGIQSFLGIGGEPVVASVNGVDITQRAFDYKYREVRAQLRERLGAAYRPGLFDEKTLRAKVLDQMIRDNLLLQVSHDMGLRASDQEVRALIVANPAFQKDGRFDDATYQRALRLRGMRPPEFENGLRQQIVSTQLGRAVVASAFVTGKELDQAIRLQGQERNISYFIVPKDRFKTDGKLTDQQIDAYYRAHQARFKVPERVKLQYLLLNAASMAPKETPSEDDLRQLYESEIDRFTQPERRNVRHILITVDPNADAAKAEAAKARIIAIRKRIESGADFAEVAKEVSEDPGSAAQGGDLGFIEKGLMDPAFDQAAFALKQGQLSEPVRTRFGYHLIEVTKIDPVKVKPFAEVKDQLLAQAKKRQLEGAYYDLAEKLANLTFESPDSLEPAAKALGLEVQTTGWIERGGGKGIFASPKVIAAAFSDDVLEDRHNSEVIEPERNAQESIVLRLVDHEDATVKPLEAVREQVVANLHDQEATEAAKAAAGKLTEQLRAGGKMTQVASGYELKQPGLVTRTKADIPSAVLERAFRLPRPQEDRPTYGSALLAHGDVAVVGVTGVVDGSPSALGQAARDQEGRELAQAIGSHYYDDVVEDLVSRAKITRKAVVESGD